MGGISIVKHPLTITSQQPQTDEERNHVRQGGKRIKREKNAKAVREHREREREKKKKEEKEREERERRAKALREDNERRRREIERTKEQIAFMNKIMPK